MGLVPLLSWEPQPLSFHHESEKPYLQEETEHQKMKPQQIFALTKLSGQAFNLKVYLWINKLFSRHKLAPLEIPNGKTDMSSDSRPIPTSGISSIAKDM